MATLRRLGPGDEKILALLARDDGEFDLAGRGAPLQPLTDEDARGFLADPRVLTWIAEQDDMVVGFMYAHVLPLRGGARREVLLYEIGVRGGWRRRGIGRALLEALDAWMGENEVEEAWVLADNPRAVDFYLACGYDQPEGDAVYMTRRR